MTSVLMNKRRLCSTHLFETKKNGIRADWAHVRARTVKHPIYCVKVVTEYGRNGEDIQFLDKDMIIAQMAFDGYDWIL